LKPENRVAIAVDALEDDIFSDSRG
jgi:hypothetical protein